MQPRAVEAFASVEQAWFWTMGYLLARQRGDQTAVFMALGPVPRPCEPDDVVKCLDRLYRNRRIDLTHARILRIWGERGTAPNPCIPTERGDARLWREAMDALRPALQLKGIVT